MSFCLHILTSPFFFFNDTATTEIYTLSLHDALPILPREVARMVDAFADGKITEAQKLHAKFYALFKDLFIDRKSTRLNSSHSQISYAVFCLKKKKKKRTTRQQ